MSNGHAAGFFIYGNSTLLAGSGVPIFIILVNNTI
ncbi:hypothetical protein GGD38_001826 [Chitinophagaceae bacterium OAS944]|nr:hypothetical protein [Chitinophagaceae bacterium OAS944]